MSTPLLPAYCRRQAFDAFRRELPRIDTPEGLLRAATAISLQTNPQASLDAVEKIVSVLATTVRRRLQTDSEQARLAHLHDVLFDLIGFRGVAAAHYYDPANSYLPTVLSTRRGIPITLVLVYRSVGVRVGLQIEGVNAPGHFLAAVTCVEANKRTVQYVDPFHGGALLSRDEAISRIEGVTGQVVPNHIDPLVVATPQAWLSRMLLNLQAIFARTGQERDLLAMQELQSLLSRPE